MASSNSGRKAINLEPYKDQILSLYSSHLSVNSILAYIQDEYSFQISKRTLENRLQQWGVYRQDRTTSSSSLLHARIRVLFFQVGLEDREILQVLEKEGYSISSRTLRRLRINLGLYRRTKDPITQQLQREEILDVLVQEAEKGIIQGYGKEMLHRYIRNKGFIIGRDRLFSAYKTVLPDAVQRRKYDLQRKRGEYIVPGPNYIWSVDGYLKLEPYGIEIYAAIDAYSRYIIWIYCGITARTAVSVLRQYLDTIEDVRLQPSKIRSDQGSEITLFQSAYFQLRRVQEPSLQLSHSWWEQLSKTALFKWRVYFASLREDGVFSKSSLADQIALYAIYIPLLRTEVYQYVQTWNMHRIRRQLKRPNSVEENIQNYGHLVNEPTLQQLKQDVQEFGIVLFLLLLIQS
ncbi:hypothetical protein BDV59DRAFT_195730 [Aspergillus ambiguus]|uniref:uncharacterized protein n=1 Tax=Aspergillus ambiguus TaxID=176160 RepID=UPI003CCE1BC2